MRHAMTYEKLLEYEAENQVEAEEEELDWGSGQTDCFSASVTGQRGR